MTDVDDAPIAGARPTWLTFDCYGTLAQWDEGLLAVVGEILARHGRTDIDAHAFIAVYDRHEHAAEQATPFKNFKAVSAYALEKAMADLSMAFQPSDADLLVSRISGFPPFPEVPQTLRALKERGYKLCVISNTDDDLITGNVGQMGGHIDRVVSAEQAQAYKPSPIIFHHAHAALGITKAEIVHICASPHLDLAAARDVGFRCIWVDRGTARKPLPDYTPDRVVPTLDAVLPVLDRSFGAA